MAVTDRERNEIVREFREGAAFNRCLRCGLNNHRTAGCRARRWDWQGFSDGRGAEDVWQNERRRSRSPEIADRGYRDRPLLGQTDPSQSNRSHPSGNVPGNRRLGIRDQHARHTSTGYEYASGPASGPASGHTGHTSTGYGHASGQTSYTSSPGNRSAGVIPPTGVPQNFLADRDGRPARAEYIYTDSRGHDYQAGDVPGPKLIMDKKALYVTAKKELVGEDQKIQNNEERLSVLANYVKIKPGKLPERIFVYELQYTYLNTSKGKTASLSRRSDLQYAFEKAWPIIREQLRVRHPVCWATNLRRLWIVHESEEPVDSVQATLPYLIREGGGIIQDLQIAVQLKETLSNVSQHLRNDDLRWTTKYLTALNALITSPIYEETARAPGIQGSLTLVGENRFFINGGFARMTGLRAHRGYTTSVRPGKDFHLLNVNTTSTAFFPRCRVSDMLYYATLNPEVLAQLDFTSIERMLTGLKLRVAYKRPQRKIGGKLGAPQKDDINSEASRLKRFKNFGKPICQQKFYDDNNPADQGRTVLDYFTKELGITDLNANGVCVNVGKKLAAGDRTSDQEESKAGAIWIPAQLLEIVPHQPVKGALCAKHTSEMLCHANRSPANNARLIVEEGLKTLGIDTDNGKNPPGFEINDKLLEVKAKILKHPNVLCDGSTADISNASWNMRKEKFSQAGSIQVLHLFVLNGARYMKEPKEKPTFIPFDDHHTRRLLRDMVRRLDFHKPDAIISDIREGNARMGDVTQLRQFLGNNSSANAAVLVVLKEHDYNLHAKIKRLADMTHGMTLVCAIASKLMLCFRGFQDQFLSNYALKFNIKSGGVNHILSEGGWSGLLGKIRNETIIMGADVAHPAVGDPAGSPSVAAVVGSVDSNFQNYPGSIRLQAGRQEWIEDMRSMVLERLKAFYKRRSKKPLSNLRVLFYRDGISESMFEECHNREIAAIRAAFLDFQAEYDLKAVTLKLTFVVVGKRHSTRFYPQDPYNRDAKTGNVKPGLLVDQVVTCPKPFNFFLQSHAAVQGTARSAHYHVLLDEMGFGSDNDDLANLTHHLCYCYQRATKGVSYAAPAYIADRLCDRGRHYLRLWQPSDDFKLPSVDPDDGARDGGGIKRWKTQMALRVAQNETMPDNDPNGPRVRVWGHYNDDPTNPPLRFNPWHPNLDDSMFWM